MRTFVLAIAASLGPLLAGDPAAAVQPGASAGVSGPAVRNGPAADNRGNADWLALFNEMQAEGLIAVRTVGSKAPPSSPSPPARGGDPVRHPQPPFPPEGIRESPCPSP